MRLQQPFYRLNLRFDAARLAAEAAALPDSAWVSHPNDIAGNSSVRLLSVDGGENDGVDGPMAMTPHLRRSPYLRQILASFGVVWSRSRLMRLAPGASVPEHADINYHWFTRVRLHIPVVTRPDVRFYCGDESVHMAAGEAWLFDNWRLHRVENPTAYERIHLVADTSGSSSFWQFVARSQSPDAADRNYPFDAQRDATPLAETAQLAPVMTPAEVDLLIMDMRAEIVGQTDSPENPLRLARYLALLENFCKDWRQLYLLLGPAKSGWPEFAKIRDSVRDASKELSTGLVIRTNRVPVHVVFEGRVLRPMLTGEVAEAPVVEPPVAVPPEFTRRHSPRPVESAPLRQPVFIVAAPRSGSTLLFETLAASEQIITVGGEAHWLVEGVEALRTGAPGVDSNRLTADAWSIEIADRIHAVLADHLVDYVGRAVTSPEGRRFLEKTPKNSLRIPLFNRLFPDAKFIFLWRDPRENLSSIIEAWRSGHWKTYNGLDGFEGPWSLILPPGWRRLNRRPLEEIAAFQWDTTNRMVLDDLAMLPAARWTALSYADFVGAPATTIERLCRWIGIDIDAALRARLAAPLPLSRFTQTAPATDKWTMNTSLIERVLPDVAATWRRLQSLR
jgi:Sulfotransferase family/Aspartyl/Asparaginyl beta-hydroxylase